MTGKFDTKRFKFDLSSDPWNDGLGKPKEVWDKKLQRYVPIDLISNGSSRKGQWWDKADYEGSLELAKATGDALLAVLTILRHRWQQRGRSGPVVLGNVALKKLGFNRWAKDRALRRLEETGFIRVARKGGSSSKITVLREF